MSKNIKPSIINSRKEWEGRVWLELAKNIKNIKDVKRIKDFLESILTSYEKKNIIKRFETIILVKNGISYREISKILWISPATIRQAKINIENGAKKYLSRNDFKKNNKKSGEKKQQLHAPESPFLEWIDSLPPMPTRSGKGRWSFLKH